ncbi:hypothetical protein B0T26DRAFT_723643 [Lasiosphaeria miniovina]|uniref:Uncharacterized protein n=1 Tax=Lasiosphaeria miniovina TaxID=1954250 RepID=A0AA40A6C2_9PEZI|nr:uncharacterized protein B0T26DRAFT_723643 [Lasiosphaeria miniovina]KAK0709966.1 hypothetical protein B0T26DRAFT_723643 [Lasiosphaeria miniovina]
MGRERNGEGAQWGGSAMGRERNGEGAQWGGSLLPQADWGFRCRRRRASGIDRRLTDGRFRSRSNHGAHTQRSTEGGILQAPSIPLMPLKEK